MQQGGRTWLSLTITIVTSTRISCCSCALAFKAYDWQQLDTHLSYQQHKSSFEQIEELEHMNRPIIHRAVDKAKPWGLEIRGKTIPASPVATATPRTAIIGSLASYLFHGWGFVLRLLPRPKHVDESHGTGSDNAKQTRGRARLVVIVALCELAGY